MSISAVSGAAQAAQQTAKPPQAPIADDVTPFSKQLGTQTAQSPSHHHHHGGASQSAAVGSGTSGIASSLLQALS
jgi:hypothetical protein